MVGEYRVIEYDGAFKIQKSYYGQQPLFFWNDTPVYWSDVNDKGERTHWKVHEFGSGWWNGKPCKTYETLEDAHKKIEIMEHGDIVHSV
jgi:hypothetical protein